MSEEWIAQLAGEIKQKDKEAAEGYARTEHYASVAAERGRDFFFTAVQCLQDDVDALRRALQGDVTSAETALERVKVDEVRITRARFPWVDARLTHKDDAITLDYAKSPGTAGDPAQGRVTRAFQFRVAAQEDRDEKVSVEEAFAADAKSYETPEAFAQAVMEILFRPAAAGSTKPEAQTEAAA